MLGEVRQNHAAEVSELRAENAELKRNLSVQTEECRRFASETSDLKQRGMLNSILAGCGRSPIEAQFCEADDVRRPTCVVFDSTVS